MIERKLPVIFYASAIGAGVALGVWLSLTYAPFHQGWWVQEVRTFCHGKPTERWHVMRVGPFEDRQSCVAHNQNQNPNWFSCGEIGEPTGAEKVTAKCVAHDGPFMGEEKK